MIVRKIGTALATVILCVLGVLAVAGTAQAAAPATRCQGEMLESVPICNEEGLQIARVQRFRESTGTNCAETYSGLGGGSVITTFVIIDGRPKVVHGGSLGVRWPADKGCVLFGGTVSRYKGSAIACD